MNAVEAFATIGKNLRVFADEADAIQARAARLEIELRRLAVTIEAALAKTGRHVGRGGNTE